MAKQMGGITLKGEEEALYTSESWSNNRLSTKRGYNGDKRSHQGTSQLERACWSKKKSVESNVAISKKKTENEWEAEVLCPIVEDELALMAMMEEHIDYEDD